MMATATVATVSTGLLSYKTISYTASTIYTLAESVFYKDPYVDLSSLETLEKKLDVMATIKIYDLWIQEVVEKSDSFSNSLQEAIHSFTRGLDELHSILLQLDEKIKQHKQKWFYSYRPLSFHKEMEEIKMYKTILDQRFLLIQQVHSFYKAKTQ